MTSEQGPLPGGSASAAPKLTRNELILLLVLAAIQFTHMVDFVIIMPLGNRLQAELQIDKDQFSSLVSAYALSAGLATLLASFVMDMFDRRKILLTMYFGFTLSTLFCGLADSYEMVLLSRTFAGVFGGVAAVTLMAVIGDVFPPEKRGRATGAVVSSFAVASILGLPIGLWLAHDYGRGAPFITLAALSGVVWLIGYQQVPPVRAHIGHTLREPMKEFFVVIGDANHIWGFCFSFFLVLGTFTVASFIAPVLQNRNGWDEKQIAYIYLCAGLCTFFGTNKIGQLADRIPRLFLFRLIGSLAMLMAIAISSYPIDSRFVAALAVSMFMVCAAGRMVPAQAMLLGACLPAVRGSFMSLNTAVQHLATGLAPKIAGWVMWVDADSKLQGFWIVGLISAGTAAVSLILAGRLRRVPQGVFKPFETGTPVTVPAPSIRDSPELDGGLLQNLEPAKS